MAVPDQEDQLPARSNRKKKKQKSSGGMGWRPIAGVLAILLGCATGVGVLIAVINGNPRALGGLAVVVGFIGTGISWLRGQVHGE